MGAGGGMASPVAWLGSWTGLLWKPCRWHAEDLQQFAALAPNPSPLYARFPPARPPLLLQRDKFEDMLRELTVERADICAAMAFAMDNAESGAPGGLN